MVEESDKTEEYAPLSGTSSRRPNASCMERTELADYNVDFGEKASWLSRTQLA